ncbi:substrate-binding periplasmic protein [Actinomadura rupiterrae]|uniref:substrate-binding periplasmic protein n=1 Tax=Actinomadura rupiterrae TaxID=559627 RepID=UPI0020A5C422|nr:ABC transporter substrate-binding protein [Actinomadura rupiterrae]MCP2338553.1 polar amino acid transport system substrate-binding protein [Actinomadura rupiterrae]
MSGRSLARLSQAAAVVLAASLAAAGCGTREGEVKGVALVDRSRLTVCTHVPNPPFEERRNGRFVGFDMDLMGLVGKRLGVPVSVRQTAFDPLRSGSALSASRCDVIAAAVPITPSRASDVGLSKPYFDVYQTVVGRKGPALTSPDALKSAHLRVGTQALTQGERYLRDADLDTVSFKTPEALLNGLRTHQVDVVVEDHPVVLRWLRDPANAAFTARGRFGTGEQYGFMISKDTAPALLRFVDATLGQARADGSYQRLYQKWIGPLPAVR